MIRETPLDLQVPQHKCKDRNRQRQGLLLQVLQRRHPDPEVVNHQVATHAHGVLKAGTKRLRWHSKMHHQLARAVRKQNTLPRRNWPLIQDALASRRLAIGRALTRRGGGFGPQLIRPVNNCSKFRLLGPFGPFLELEWPRDTGCGYMFNMGGNQPHGALY